MKKLPPEDQLLFACARQDLLPAHRQVVTDLCRNGAIQWEVLYSTAERHGVAPLVYANLSACGVDMPHNVASRFRFCTVRNMAAKEDKAKKIAELLSFFNRKGIDAMLVKGAALDVLVYEQPWYIVSDDADILLRVRVEDLTDAEHAEVWSQTRQHLWLECDYFEHHDVTMKGALPVDFQRIWNDAARVDFRGQSVFVMSPEDLLIATCINGCRKRFFRLKAVCDIASIVSKFSGLKWDAFVRKARDYDCHNIVYAALFATQTTLGCELPAGVLAALKVNPLRAALIRYLSRRRSWSSLSSLYAGKNILGKRLNCSLLLPYATYRGYQVWRNARGAWRAMRQCAAEARSSPSVRNAELKISFTGADWHESQRG